MNGVQTLDSEFFRPTSSCHGISFPLLEVLEFEFLENWETWSSTDGDDNNETGVSFPCLREIIIADCRKLAVVSIGLIPSLDVLTISNSSEAVFRKMVDVAPSVRKLYISNIQGLTHLQGDSSKYHGGKDANLGDSLRSVTEVTLRGCRKLESYHCLKGVESLAIENCPSMTSFTFELPSSLKVFEFSNRDILESCHHNIFLSSLESLKMLKSLRLITWSKLKSFPESCFLHLTDLTISSCDEIESIPEKGCGFLPLLCLRSLQITYCTNLKSLPHQQFQSLTSLKTIEIHNCPSMTHTFLCGLWPPNIAYLRIGGLKKPMSEWGLQNFPASLIEVYLYGRNSGVVSFANQEDVSNTTTNSSSFLLPPSLTLLEIKEFVDLESISEGLQHLTRLESLEILACPKLKDLPETLLPSLSYLDVYSSVELEKRCLDRKGEYWSIISEIPYSNLTDS